MVFNVPLTVPIVEFLVIYSGLRALQTTKMPQWVKPFVVGDAGDDLRLLARPDRTVQVFTTREGSIGRWSWFIGVGDMHIFNRSGLQLIRGGSCSADTGRRSFFLGRWWHKKSGYSTVVGYVYPVVCMIAALAYL